MLPLCLSLKVCILKVYHLVCLFEYVWFYIVWICLYIWTLSLFESLSNYVFVWIYLNLCLYEIIWKFEGLYVWIILFEFWRFVFLSLFEMFSNSLSLGLSFSLSLEVSYALLIVQCLSLNLGVICMSIVCVHYILSLCVCLGNVS